MRNVKGQSFAVSLAGIASTVLAFAATPACAQSPTHNSEAISTDTVSGTTTPSEKDPANAPQGFVKPAAPIPITSYVVDLPSTTYKTQKNKEAKVTPQLLFLDESAAKKAFSAQAEIQKMIQETYGSTKQDLKTEQGRTALKGEVMNRLAKAGYMPDGVLWNKFVF